MRILYLGSGPFGVPTLERLATLRTDVVVGTVPDAPRGRHGRPEPTAIKTRARELGLTVSETPSLKGSRGPEFLGATGGELVITCDFRLILGRRFLDAPRFGCWNLHGSVLPRHRGAAPIARGILVGDEEFGVTLYRMVFALDAGPVVDAARFRPERPMDAVELEEHLSHDAADLLERWLPTLESGDAPVVPQDEVAATLAPKLDKNDGWIDWKAPADAIERRVRAMRPWPRAFTEWGNGERGRGERIFVDRAVVETEGNPDSAAGAEPGEVRGADASGIRVACGDGTDTLRILTLQRAGKRSLMAEEFLRGFTFSCGRFLAPPQEQIR